MSSVDLQPFKSVTDKLYVFEIDATIEELVAPVLHKKVLKNERLAGLKVAFVPKHTDLFARFGATTE